MTASQVSEGRVAEDLYDLSEALGRRDPERQAHGFLGGEWCYGQDFENDVFEMHPFWWGDCECGHKDREVAWLDERPHLDDCYQTALKALGGGFDNAPRLAAEWRLPEYGCAVHCTCGQQEEWREWIADNPHPVDCPQVRPNFRHKASGVQVRWYKYIGRSMEISEVSRREWQVVIDRCLASVESCDAAPMSDSPLSTDSAPKGTAS